MKCALITDSAFPESNGIHMQAAVAGLEGLGIQYDRFIANVSPSEANLTANYDFILLPRIRSTEFRAKIDSSDLDIPIFVLDVTSVSATQLSSVNPGVGTMTNANADFFINVPWSDSNFFAAFGDRWSLTTGTSFFPIQATSPITGSAQTGAGDTMGWYATRSGDGNLYCTSLQTDSQPVLVFLLQLAYSLGDFTKAQMQSLNRLPVIIDQDHITGTGWNNDVDILNRFLSRIPDGGVVWCGVNGGSVDGTSHVDTTSDAVMASLQSSYDQGKLKFCYHNHYVPWDPLSGTWPNITDLLTKAQQITNYATLKSAWDARNASAGTAMSFNDSEPWYYDPGNNMWNEATLQMMYEKGCRMMRYAGSNECSRPCHDATVAPLNSLRRRELVGGMTLMPSSDYSAATSLTTAAAWRGKTQLLEQSIHYSRALYFHDTDFTDTQDPASALYGVELMDQLNDLGDWAKETIKVFANPIDYIW